MKTRIKTFSNFFFFLSITILIFSTTVQAVEPTAPLTNYEDGKYMFGTFITSNLNEADKQFMRNCLNNKQRFMSIDYTADKPLFTFGVVPSDASFINFEKTNINGVETVIANFNSNIDRIVFEAKDNHYIFKNYQSDNKIVINYLIDTTYFNNLNQKIDIPQLSYDWQKYIPALLKMMMD